MEYSGAPGTLINEKKSCIRLPLKGLSHEIDLKNLNKNI